MSQKPGYTSAPEPNPRMEKTLVAATKLATAMGQSWVGTEHVLLALLDDPDGIAGQVLNRGDRGAVLRQEIEAIMRDPLYMKTSHRVIR